MSDPKKTELNEEELDQVAGGQEWSLVYENIQRDKSGSGDLAAGTETAPAGKKGGKNFGTTAGGAPNI